MIFLFLPKTERVKPPLNHVRGEILCRTLQWNTSTESDADWVFNYLTFRNVVRKIMYQIRYWYWETFWKDWVQK